MTLPAPLENIERLVVVVGCQRSGTTLTGQLLGADSSALLIDEFDGLYPWFHAVIDDADDKGVKGARMLAQAAAKYRTEDERFCRIGGNLRLASHVKVLVLKAPNLTFDQAEIARAPLPVTIVYPVRDPRAVVASMAMLSDIDFIGNQLRLIAERPVVTARHGAEVVRLGDDRIPLWIRQTILWKMKSDQREYFDREGLYVHWFRYEDLIGGPSDVLAPVLEMCGLDPHGASRAYCIYVGYGPGHTDRTRPVDATSIAKWREVLTPAQQADIMRAAEPLAGRIGYA